MMIPATWATREIPNKAGKGAPTYVLTDQFRQEWTHSVTPSVCIHVDFPGDQFNFDEFNSEIRPFSHVKDTAQYLIKDITGKAKSLKYIPSRPPGIFTENGRRYINTHVAPDIEPIEDDIKIFDDFMEHLVPDSEDRERTKKWCATLIARPDIKMSYGMLMISENQGVGKTTLAERILKPLVGESNTSSPNETDVSECQFNYWCAHKRLAIINEIYAGQSSKVYNKLKGIITDTSIMINKKNMAAYEIDNWVHVYACSNSRRALKMSRDDRRWFVPQVTEFKLTDTWTKAKWSELFNWLKNGRGLNTIRYWADEYVKKQGHVLSGEEAPNNVTKRKMVDEGMSDGERLVCDVLDEITERMPNANDVILSDMLLIEVIKEQLHNGKAPAWLEKPLTVRKCAKAKGWFVGEGRIVHTVQLNLSKPVFAKGCLISKNKGIAERDQEKYRSNDEKVIAFNDLMKFLNDKAP